MKTLLIGAAAAALAVAPALAQQAPPTPPGVAQGTTPVHAVPPVPPLPPLPPVPHSAMHMRMMSDHVMTRDEVVRHVREMFAKLDANHDGFITRDEVEAFHRKFAGMAEMGRAMAAKGRDMGEMGREMAHRFDGHDMPMPDRSAMFDKLDTNHDGVISRQEFMAAKPEVHERRMIVMREDGAAGAPEPGMMAMHMHAMAGMHEHMGMHAGMGFGAHLFEMADTNHDGRVSLAEAEAAALAHFDKADLDHDGKITPEERAQAHAMMREHHPG